MLDPFSGWLVDTRYAGRVVIPPYDVLTPADRRELLDTNPDSYLHAILDPIDHPHEDRLAMCRAAIDRLVGSRMSDRFPDRYAVYRLTLDGRSMTGLVGLMRHEKLRETSVLGHEQVKPDRVKLLAEYLVEVRASSSPAAVAVRDDVDLRAVLASLTARPADLVVLPETARGVTQEVWLVEPSTDLAALADDFDPIYIVDGHHRIAAAAAVEDVPILGVVFPASELRIEAFHRVLGPLEAIERADLTAKLESSRCHVSTATPATNVVPERSWFSSRESSTSCQCECLRSSRFTRMSSPGSIPALSPGSAMRLPEPPSRWATTVPCSSSLRWTSISCSTSPPPGMGCRPSRRASFPRPGPGSFSAFPDRRHRHSSEESRQLFGFQMRLEDGWRVENCVHGKEDGTPVFRAGRRHEFLERAQPVFEVGPLEAADATALVSRQIAFLVEVDRDELPVGEGEPNVHVDQATEGLLGAPGVGHDVFGGGFQVLGRPLGRRDQECQLVRIVPVDGRAGDAHLGADLIDAGPVEAVLAEQANGSFENLFLPTHGRGSVRRRCHLPLRYA